jgi:anti-sigma factor ChrR (cupin superfamily)
MPASRYAPSTSLGAYLLAEVDARGPHQCHQQGEEHQDQCPCLRKKRFDVVVQRLHRAVVGVQRDKESLQATRQR